MAKIPFYHANPAFDGVVPIVHLYTPYLLLKRESVEGVDGVVASLYNTD